MQASKPGPVLFHHLSGPGYPGSNDPPNSIRASNPQTWNLFGLSARKVYPAHGITTLAVSSYLTFSPLSRYKPERFVFCGTLSVPIHIGTLPLKKYVTLCCPDFPS